MNEENTEQKEELKPRKIIIHGNWVPARPLKYSLIERFKDSILVLIGECDAIVWPETEERVNEEALGSLGGEK